MPGELPGVGRGLGWGGPPEEGGRCRPGGGGSSGNGRAVAGDYFGVLRRVAAAEVGLVAVIFRRGLQLTLPLLLPLPGNRRRAASDFLRVPPPVLLAELNLPSNRSDLRRRR